jgi:hypothetical protein
MRAFIRSAAILRHEKPPAAAFTWPCLAPRRFIENTLNIKRFLLKAVGLDD